MITAEQVFLIIDCAMALWIPVHDMKIEVTEEVVKLQLDSEAEVAALVEELTKHPDDATFIQKIERNEFQIHIFLKTVQ